MKTSKGYSIAWLTKCTYQVQGFEGYRGRVRVVADDPYFDEVVRWDSNSQPINHEYGQLLRTGLKSATVSKPSGFDNIFSNLRSGGR